MMQGSLRNANKSGKASSRERKLALQQDVDRLKKQLRHEENIHRALERAFNRPLGALPRLPPYLPPYILALLAEVAVLEEEIVRLEEQVVHFRQDLYQEAVYMSSSMRKLENSVSAPPNKSNPTLDSPKLDKLKSLTQTAGNSTATSETKPTTTLTEDRQGKENQSCTNSSKSRQQSSNQMNKTPIKNIDSKSLKKRLDHPKRKQEPRVNNQQIADVRNHSPHKNSPEAQSPNIISENILKCLSNILLRMSAVKNPGSTCDMAPLWDLKPQNCDEEADFWDPYGICLEFGKRHIGPYKQLCAIDAKSFNPKRTANTLFLLHRLKLLFRKVASVNLENLNHQEKLAFWINIYNSCMMNFYFASGIHREWHTRESSNGCCTNAEGNNKCWWARAKCNNHRAFHFKTSLSLEIYVFQGNKKSSNDSKKHIWTGTVRTPCDICSLFWNLVLSCCESLHSIPG
ncbi:uncharacterized protein LOC114393786 isoform X3 [Glycine soja]|uniref:Ternary complex factor MIP1 leucine-zipper domain-containing protein n=1 Tax=Glycine soja TaxID=3848 RepID=A0A445GBG7_GLYSO|nr:uncharacterized protein LOC114393786 isoform X3 [Glycine soja]RZB58514.1 hypothetical protein D0Y65_046894 [Glycine soja]